MNARRGRVALVVSAGLLLSGVLAGCSQIAAIAPVGGSHLAEVRYAAIDLLVEAEVDILTAPVCAQAPSGEVSCQGETTDGTDIRVVSPADDQAVLTVTVGDDELYAGSIMDVINKAARNG